MSLSAGQVLNKRYRIEQLVGQGGMGSLYRAWDLNLNMRIAVKENLDTSPEAQKQFSREALVLARLAHPNLARVIDHFIIPGQGGYFVMDFVEGEDLQAMVNQHGILPESRVINWIVQVCDALDYLHSQPVPIIHRDIKPANIKIRPDGRAVLIDFGIAKAYEPSISTTTAARAVTSGYSPPEQYGAGSTDQRSDIYALGATLYTLVTGQVPPDSVMLATGQASLTPRQINSGLSLHIERAILKAMALSPAERFQSIPEMRQSLEIPSRAIPARAIPRETKKNKVSKRVARPIETIAGKYYYITSLIMLLGCLVTLVLLGIVILELFSFRAQIISGISGTFSPVATWTITNWPWAILIFVILVVITTRQSIFDLANKLASAAQHLQTISRGLRSKSTGALPPRNAMQRSQAASRKASRAISHPVPSTPTVLPPPQSPSPVSIAPRINFPTEPLPQATIAPWVSIENPSMRLKSEHIGWTSRAKKHVIEDLILQEDFERLKSFIVDSEGGKFVLTGYGRFGGTSLIKCNEPS